MQAVLLRCAALIQCPEESYGGLQQILLKSGEAADCRGAIGVRELIWRRLMAGCEWCHCCKWVMAMDAMQTIEESNFAK
jgi:hypothetical protein